jgi:hypothetical protein
MMKSDRIKELIRDLQGRVGGEEGGGHPKRPRATKKGPGRYHSDGLKTYRAPKGPGIGAEWLGQRENIAKSSDRALKRQLGARQFKRLQREQRRAG